MTKIDLNPNPPEVVLENFMKEFFCFDSLLKAGFFTKEMRGNYEAQAERVRTFFGFETVYEYGAKKFKALVNHTDPKKSGLREYGGIYD